MTTPPPRPAPEAVEAALAHSTHLCRLPWETCIRSFTIKGYWALNDEKDEAAVRILAAEVVALRNELQTRHTEYSKTLNRRVDVENALLRVAAGKRDTLTPEECRNLAAQLGTSPP